MSNQLPEKCPICGVSGRMQYADVQTMASGTKSICPTKEESAYAICMFCGEHFKVDQEYKGSLNYVLVDLHSIYCALNIKSALEAGFIPIGGPYSDSGTIFQAFYRQNNPGIIKDKP